MKAGIKRILKHIIYWLYAATLPLLFVCCRHIDAPGPEKVKLDSALTLPPSYLSVPISYPIRELELLLNQKLDKKIIEAPIAIGQKGDSLFLTISKFKPVTMQYDGIISLTYQVPLLITGSVHGRLLGIGLKNKTPVQTKIIVALRTKLNINDDWHLTTITSIENIQWVEEPVFHFAGLKFNLISPIEKALDKNQEKITAKIDQVIEKVIPLERTIRKLWADIQKPILINKKLKPIWLKAEPIGMGEKILGMFKDTLTVLVNLKTRLRTVLDTAGTKVSLVPLSKQEHRHGSNASMNAYLLATLPFEDINLMSRQLTDTMRFKFQNNEVRIKSSELYGTDDGLAIKLELVGDVNARIYLKGNIGYDSSTHTLVLNDFGFDVNSEHSLVQAADWFSHDDIVNRVRPHLAVSVGKSIKALPSLILQGVEKGKLGHKMDVSLSNFDAGLYQYLVTRDNIQVIIHATGQMGIRLEKEIFEGKKKR